MALSGIELENNLDSPVQETSCCTGSKDLKFQNTASTQPSEDDEEEFEFRGEIFHPMDSNQSIEFPSDNADNIEKELFEMIDSIKKRLEKDDQQTDSFLNQFLMDEYTRLRIQVEDQNIDHKINFHLQETTNRRIESTKKQVEQLKRENKNLKHSIAEQIFRHSFEDKNYEDPGWFVSFESWLDNLCGLSQGPRDESLQPESTVMSTKEETD